MEDKEIYKYIWLLAKKVLAMEQLLMKDDQLWATYQSYLEGNKIIDAIHEEKNLRDFLEGGGAHLEGS